VPTYEYACRECGEHLEVHQTFDDAALSECPACHGPLRKVFGSIAIAFKGSGFYKTDSRSGRRPAATPSGEKAEGASGDGAKRDGDGAKRDGDGAKRDGDGAKRDGESGSSKSDPAAKPEGDGGKSASQSEASSTTS